MESGSTDEFFGDQSSDSDCDTPNNQNNSANKPRSNPFGSAASHDYNSRASSIKTLSYLDGFDGAKEEKLQEGFCDGYKQAFGEAFRIGQQLGSLSAKVALRESLTLMHQLKNSSDDATINKNENEDAKKNLHNDAMLVRDFLKQQVLIGSADTEKDDYCDALKILSDQLQNNKAC